MTKKFNLLIMLFILGCSNSVISAANELLPVKYNIDAQIENVEPDEALSPFKDVTTGLMGYKNKNGKIIIKPTFYAANLFSKYKIADVQKSEQFNDWYKINQKGQIISKSFFFDNGPDYLISGLSRFIENNKVGFIDKEGKIIIPASFDHANSFSYTHPITTVCNGCKISSNHKEIKGGSWGAINKEGEVIVPLIYEALATNPKDQSDSSVIFKKKNQYYKLYFSKTEGYKLLKFRPSKPN